jgi:tetratricopeptide (TPR) repeat protein
MIRSYWPFRVVLPLVLLVLLTLPASAADSWPVPRGPSHEPNPYRYDPEQFKRLPKEFLEDAAACVLYAGNTHLVQLDGTIESIVHEITRLNGRKGVEKLGESRNIAYDPSYQKLTLNEARIHKADGRTLEVEARHVQLRDVATDYQVYDHDKQLIISFPTLEVGDVIEVKWSVRGKHPEHGGQFFTRYSFGDPTFPVVLDLFRVRLPKSKPFHYATVGAELVPERSEEGDFRTYTWRAHNCRKMPQDENLPSRESLFQSVACSTFADWKEVGQWKKRLRADCWECTAEVREIVRRVTRGLTRPEEKARALTHWMRRNIRYVSTGEKHDYTPHAPAVVLANRFGDCKDTSQLLAVMLREAGLRVELATLGAQDDGQVIESVPSPWGTHAILLVTIDGKQHWIDTTASLAGWDFLPRDDRDRLCYVVDEQGTLRLVRTPGLRAEDNRVEQTTHVWIGADGSSRGERMSISHGSAAMGQRDTFLEVPAGERRRQVTTELQDSNSRTRLVHLQLDEVQLSDYDRPVRTRMAFEIANHFTGNNEREGSFADSKVWHKLLAYNLDYERTVALNLNQPVESRHRYVIHLPAAYYLDSVPRDMTVRTPWAVFTRTVKTPKDEERTREVEIQFHLRLDKWLIEPADFKEYRRLHEEVNTVYRAWLTLKPAGDKADVPLLEAALHWTPWDSDSAAILARLYLKQNQPAEARRVLTCARVYHPNDTELCELTVLAAKTSKEKEAAQRELVKRHPQDVRHAIKLGAILIGAGRQEEARSILEPLTQKGAAAERARAHFQLARSYYRRDQLNKALEHWEKAALMEPDAVHEVRAYHLKGRIYEELGRPKDAEEAYELALEVERDSELALDSLVHLELATKNRPRALEYLRRYALAVGEDAGGLLLAAGYYLRLELYEEALELAQRAGPREHPDSYHRILGLVAYKRSDAAGAVEHLVQAEFDPEVTAGLLNSYLALGRLREATEHLPAAERMEKPTPELLGILKRVRQLQARRTQLEKTTPAPEGKSREWAVALDSLVCAEVARAEAWPQKQIENLLRGASANGLELGPVFALRGRLALDSGKLSKALAEAERAVALAPRDAGGWYVRGRVRLERGDREALSDLLKAAELSSRQDADVLHALADALFRAGRVEQALVAQRAAVKMKPKDADMAEQLAAFEKAASRSPKLPTPQR